MSERKKGNKPITTNVTCKILDEGIDTYTPQKEKRKREEPKLPPPLQVLF
jgi:hypothetical protein